LQTTDAGDVSVKIVCASFWIRYQSIPELDKAPERGNVLCKVFFWDVVISFYRGQSLGGSVHGAFEG
jgi:hypothetical protein